MKIKISYEGMPFEHMNNLKVVQNVFKGVTIVTQPNIFYLDGDVSELEKKCDFLFNAKFEDYNNIIGLTYDECREKISKFLADYKVLNERFILHKNACLYINPKMIMFDIDTMNLPVDVIVSVMNDQLIFFTEDSKCIFICEHECHPSIDSIKLILHGRLYDRVIAIERDLKKFDVSDYRNEVIMDLCEKMNANRFLCEHVYYDRYSRTVNEDLWLLGTISAIKFNDIRLRQIHMDGLFDEEIMTVKCIMHLSNLLMYELPSGNLDPFGVKKSADFVVNYALNNSINIPSLTAEIDEFLRKRLINKIKGSYLVNCRDITWKDLHVNKDIVIAIDSIKRLIKLVQKVKPTEEIELTEHEKNLSLMNVDYGTINNVVNEFIKYVDSTIVGKYIQRTEIIRELIKKIQSIIDIK
jgi:hypothetical protein